MPYTGPEPARRPLSSDDITDGIISTADLADSAVTIAKIDDAKLTALSSVMSSTATAAAQRAALGLDTGDTPDFTGVTFGGIGDALDYYDEGTWTPVLTVGGVDKTTSAQGFYTRIGEVCHVQAYVAANRGTDTGQVLITGLPFTVRNVTSGPPMKFIGYDNTDPYNGGLLAHLKFSENTTTIYCYTGTTSGTWALTALESSTFMRASYVASLVLSGSYVV